MGNYIETLIAREGVCHDCGTAKGTRKPKRVHTRWEGVCVVCGEYRSARNGGVTAGRHYGVRDAD